MGSKRWKRMTQLENGTRAGGRGSGAGGLISPPSSSAALEQQLQLADWAPDQACYFCDAAATVSLRGHSPGPHVTACAPSQEPAGAPSDDYASFKSFQMELDEQSTGSDQASGNCHAAAIAVWGGSLLPSPAEVSAPCMERRRHAA